MGDVAGGHQPVFPYGLYRFIRKKANGKDAVRTADDDTLVIVAIGMMMSEFQPGHPRIHDIGRMIEWAKHNTAVHDPTHVVIVAVTLHEIKEEWTKSFIKTVELAGLSTTVIQVFGNRKIEDLRPKSIMRDATDLLKSDGSARAIVQKLHLDTHPMQADLVTSDSSSPAPYIPVAELRATLHKEFAPEGSLFVRHNEFGAGIRTGGQYKITNLRAFAKRWSKFENFIEFTPQTELATREGEEKMPLFRSGHGPADERGALSAPALRAGGGSLDEPWTTLGITQAEYNEGLTLNMLADEGIHARMGGANV